MAISIRDWARAQGYEVGARGRLSQEIRDAYLTAMGPEAYPVEAEQPARDVERGFSCAVCAGKFRTEAAFTNHRADCRKENGK